MSRRLFKKLSDAERRSRYVHIRVTPAEQAEIQEAADIRKMSVGDYARRAMLGRRADVRYDMEIVRIIALQIQVIRELHAQVVERGLPPSTEVLRALVDEGIAAMRRIDK